MTHECCIKFAPGFDTKVLTGPVRGGGTVYGDLSFLPDRKSVPVLVNHQRQIGTADQLWQWEVLDDRSSEPRKWWVARCSIADPPEWLGKRTKASFGLWPVTSYDVGGWRCVAQAWVKEITVLSADREPAEPLAEVVLFREEAEPAARRVRAEPPAAAHDTITDPPRWLHKAQIEAARRGNVVRVGGRVLGVR